MSARRESWRERFEDVGLEPVELLSFTGRDPEIVYRIAK